MENFVSIIEEDGKTVCLFNEYSTYKDSLTDQSYIRFRGSKDWILFDQKGFDRREQLKNDLIAILPDVLEKMGVIGLIKK